MEEEGKAGRGGVVAGDDERGWQTESEKREGMRSREIRIDGVGERLRFSEGAKRTCNRKDSQTERKSEEEGKRNKGKTEKGTVASEKWGVRAYILHKEAISNSSAVQHGDTSKVQKFDRQCECMLFKISSSFFPLVSQL